MTLKELQNKWNKEKEFYRHQEVGSGVHSFIRDCLENKELFSLKPSSLSTKKELRKHEYIHEEKAKEKRQADFAIYIDSDIIIPLEAECYGHIEEGKEQLFNYQKDFDKQYGILTDGFDWRFYNNNVYRSFTLQEILEKHETFLEFWKEYTKPESYYISFFEPRGQLSLFKKIDDLHVDKYRQTFFADITRLIRSLKNKLQIEGYFNGIGNREREKKAVEITYAYIIQFVLYKTLVDNGFGQFNREFNSKTEKIHEYLQTKRYKDVLGIIDGISAEISTNIYRPFAKEQQFIGEKLLALYRKPENNLADVSPWLDIFTFIKKYSFSNIQNEIFGYIYENYLKELYEEKQKGQYFTDPAIVNFMLRQVGFTPEIIKQRYESNKNSISLIDPSCGSGTFLYSAVDAIIAAFGPHSLQKSRQIEEAVNKNIFGLDISEFPLYLAEMSILMRLLPLIMNQKYNNPVERKIKVFLTKDSVSEFIDTGVASTASNFPNQGALLHERVGLGYDSYVREEVDLEEMKSSLEMKPHSKCDRYRFDFVIGNPPYVGYNECIRQKVAIFELMKQRMVKLNNVYGVNLHSVPDNPKRYRPNPNLYSFFIALGLALLKDNGRFSYIVPQTFLIDPDYDVLRYHLAQFVRIEKIIIFSGKMFIDRGLKQNKSIFTSSLILVVEKRNPISGDEVEIIYYTEPNDPINLCLQNIEEGRRVQKTKIMQRELLVEISNWNFIRQTASFNNFRNLYKTKTDPISLYYEHNVARPLFGTKFIFDGGYDIDERKALPVSDHEDDYEILSFPDQGYVVKWEKNTRYWPDIRTPDKPYNINLRQANQGYSLLDSKYKVIWPYLRSIRFVFSDRRLIWSRRTMNTYYGIGSDNRNEILYLLSLLNSPITENMINSFKLDNESKRGIMVSAVLIKQQIRVPKITEINDHIKREIIAQTDKLVSLEKVISDCVDFSGILLQQADEIAVDGHFLLLIKGSQRIKLPISESHDLVRRVIEENYLKDVRVVDNEKLNVMDLRNLALIDRQAQNTIKNQIDHLVYALYLDLPLTISAVSDADIVKTECKKSPYYKLIFSGG